MGKGLTGRRLLSTASDEEVPLPASGERGVPPGAWGALQAGLRSHHGHIPLNWTACAGRHHQGRVSASVPGEPVGWVPRLRAGLDSPPSSSSPCSSWGTLCWPVELPDTEAEAFLPGAQPGLLPSWVGLGRGRAAERQSSSAPAGGLRGRAGGAWTSQAHHGCSPELAPGSGVQRRCASEGGGSSQSPWPEPRAEFSSWSPSLHPSIPSLKLSVPAVMTTSSAANPSLSAPLCTSLCLPWPQCPSAPPGAPRCQPLGRGRPSAPGQRSFPVLWRLSGWPSPFSAPGRAFSLSSLGRGSRHSAASALPCCKDSQQVGSSGHLGGRGRVVSPELSFPSALALQSPWMPSQPGEQLLGWAGLGCAWPDAQCVSHSRSCPVTGLPC